MIGCLNVADLCAEKNVYHLLYATGCIFEYDDEFKIGGKGFKEEDKPNFHGSYYSHTKAIVEELLSVYPTTLLSVGFGRLLIGKARAPRVEG